MTKIAAIQMCSSDNVDENLLSAEKYISESAKNGAKVAVLPEYFPYIGDDKPSIQEKFGHGKIQYFLSVTAKKHNIWIIGGTFPLSCTIPRKTRAACLVFDHQGELITRYDKIHMFDVTLSDKEKYLESSFTDAGDELVCIDTPAGKIGLGVCFDIRFPEMFKKLVEKGAEIIALPTSFTVPTGEAHWNVLARATAIYNLSYFVGACQGGTHSTGRKTYGHSIIVDPWGKVISEKTENTPGIIYADIDLDEVKRVRKVLPVL
ncbi:MAG: carbon-nitrogen hydrolase family protein [Gammaproteobacteria bacterium]|nr:carbon-nitrogen hydrolase family protein [Gammaproteobacteria bacterium]